MRARKAVFLSIVVILCSTGASWAQVAGRTIPNIPYVEAATGQNEPMSMCVFPNGEGPDFDDAADGHRLTGADATISLILYSDQPPWGDPVPGYPAEDMWLESHAETFAHCAGGTIPDAPTDENGETYWLDAPLAGGWFEPTPGHELWVWVNGWECAAPGLAELRFNSPDINGDLIVNLVDIALFAQDLMGTYNYRSDLAWDGDINLADLGMLSRGLGAECP